MPDYEPPELEKDAFHCSHCDAYAHHGWDTLFTNYNNLPGPGTGREQVMDAMVSRCSNCHKVTIWNDAEMFYPKTSTAPKPAEDLPDSIRPDFNEARYVVDDSPRAAAALLRLSIEKLARELTGEDNKRLYDLIGDLVEDGRIDPRVQRALDTVRVTGNESVHPGKLDLRDDRETALRLFELVNTIVELTITRERLIEEAYDSIPQSQRESIADRDNSE